MYYRWLAAAMGIVSMLMYGVGIELYKMLYLYAGMMGFAFLSTLVALLYWRLSRDVVQRAMAARVTGHGTKQGSAR